MSWPAALLTKRRRRLAVFALAELTLAMAVPFLAIAGYHALLDSRAGRFVEEPQEGDPGWRAIVDPSPVSAVVEVGEQGTTGLVLLAGHPDEGAPGTAILVPGTLEIDGVSLASLEPNDAVSALSSALRLRVKGIEVMTAERWSETLGTKTYLLPNPDPVVDDAGQPLLAVGDIEVGGDNAAVFLARPAPGLDPITVMYRRELLWSALLADPPTAADADPDGGAVGLGGVDTPLVAALDQVAGASARVVDLPLTDLGPDPAIDAEAAEALIREVVPVPAGSNPGDRLQVRVIDRTGQADLPAVAAEVASTGSEVVEIGNASEFSGGETHLVVPFGLDDPGINELALLTGATTVLDEEADADAVVTLVIGSDFVANR
ncbi:MAG: hypothetical protein AAGA59_25255 [Actinomycetota bacterium]